MIKIFVDHVTNAALFVIIS